MEFLQSIALWQLFLSLGVVFCVAEIFIPGFVVLPLGLGFLLSAPLVYFVNEPFLQWAVLAGMELLTFVILLRFKPKISRPVVYSNVEGMIGKECEVTETVTTKKAGYVKLYGDRWQAVSYEMKGFQVGEKAVIKKVDGNKVHIEKLND